MIDTIVSDEYTKIYKAYHPMKNYDLVQDRFFIYNAVTDIPLKKNTFITFDYVFQDIGDNLNSSNLNKENISKNDNEIYNKILLISSNNISI